MENRTKIAIATAVVVAGAATVVIIESIPEPPAPIISYFAGVVPGFGITSIVVSSNVTVSWSGGTPPFQLQRKDTITGPWLNVGAPTMSLSAVDSVHPQAYYRVASVSAPASWPKRFGGPFTDYGSAVGVDGDNHIVTTGIFSGTNIDFTGNGTGTPGNGLLTSAGGYDVYVAKYATNGSFIWAMRFGGTGNEVVRCLALDSSGNAFLGGNFLTGTLAKVTSAGVFQWVKGAVPYGLNTVDFAGVAVDSSGNVATTGNFYTINFANQIDFGNGHTLFSDGVDCFLAKYDSDGTCLFATRFAGGDTQFGWGVNFDAADNIFLTGYGFASINLGGGILNNGTPLTVGVFGFLGKFNNAGTYIWGRTVGRRHDGDPQGSYGRVQTMTLNSAGDVIVGGEFQSKTDLASQPGMDSVSAVITGTSANFDVFVSKYSGADGHWIWCNKINGNLVDYAKGLATDDQLNTYMSGSFQGVITVGSQTLTTTGLQNTTDAYVTKINSSGNFLWAKKYGGVLDDAAYSMAVDASGAPVATGMFQTNALFDGQTMISAGGLDAFLIRPAQ